MENLNLQMEQLAASVKTQKQTGMSPRSMPQAGAMNDLSIQALVHFQYTKKYQDSWNWMTQIQELVKLHSPPQKRGLKLLLKLGLKA
jgi:hypothetical protein